MSDIEVEYEKYLAGLLAEITRIKERKGKVLFRVSDVFSNETSNRIKAYFESEPSYTVELKKCARCSNKWDVIITF